MSTILITYAHPNYANSRMNQSILEAIQTQPNITINNLYQKYPDEKLNILEQQQLLLDHEIIALQFPFYWFSMPSLLKKWIDEVFSYNFAYGPEGYRLANKALLVITTTGGSHERYNQVPEYDMQQLLKPLAITASYCKMNYLPPLVLADSELTDRELSHQSQLITNQLISYL